MRGLQVYIYQKAGWPVFIWDSEGILLKVSTISHKQGRLLGRMEHLGFNLQSEAILQTMTTEAIKSSEIEGEVLDPDQVRSSIARRLGIDIGGLMPIDRNVEGIVEMMLDATQNFQKQLTEDRLFGWQTALFPGGRSGMQKITVGNWRDNSPDDPMQVVSGAMGKEKVHYQAPDADKVPDEMNKFLTWYNSSIEINPILKAGIAHLWFVTIHPFDDGNGRVARTITDMQLARADGIPQRFYSMSGQVRLERNEYYNILEKTQKSSLDITEWLIWFLDCLERVLNDAEKLLSVVIYKSRYWDWLKEKSLNEGQKLIINKLLDGFNGKLTTSKWAKIAKCSSDSALRDIQNLITQGILEKESGGGRSTSYSLVALRD